MAGRTKRKPPYDPNRSDSDDETYGTSVPKPARSKSSKSQGARPRKKQRRNYSDDDDDEDDDESVEDSLSEAEEDDDEEVDLGPTGRPKRRSAPKKFEEEVTDEDEDEFEEKEEDDIKDDDDEEEPLKSRKKKIITLHVTPGKLTGDATIRRTSGRKRSSSAVSTRPTSSNKPPSRRSSRIAQEDIEAAMALTPSGRHAEIFHQESSSPPAGKRPARGGKSVKKPTTSTVFEESQESAKGREPSTDELQQQLEIAASREDLSEIAAEQEDPLHEEGDEDEDAPVQEGVEIVQDVAIIPESDEEEDPISHGRRGLRRRESKPVELDEGLAPERQTRKSQRSTLGKRKARSGQRENQESSDFEPVPDEGGEEDVSDSEASASSPRKGGGDESSPGGRAAKRRKINSRSRRASDENDSYAEADELAEEIDDLKGSNSRRRAARARAEIIMEPRTRRVARNRPDYRIINPELQFPPEEDDDVPVQNTPSKRNRTGGSGYRSLFSTYGPFGGAGGPAPVLGGPAGLGATAGADSDSSDDENMARPKPPGIGGLVGMTPTAAPNLGLFPAPAGQAHGADPAQTPSNLGRIKDKQALADADPLGVDQNVNFDAVGAACKATSISSKRW